MKRFTDSYLDYARDFTDCPDVFLTWGALLAISASLSRAVFVEIGSWNISPHIWIVLIGKSSSHKSTAITIVEDLIESINPERCAPHEFTSEAIIQSLSKGANRLFIFDEAKSFFDMLGKKYNESLKSLFTILYRKPTYTRTTMKHGTLSIQGAYLPMGLATTPEWLKQSLQDAEQSAMSGFLARFLMIPFSGSGGKPMAKPPPHNVEKFGVLKDILRSYLQIERPFSYAPDADAALEVWYGEMTGRENQTLPVLGPFFEHLKNEAIHKVSILMAVDRGEEIITLSAFREAALALSYIEEQLPTLLHDMTASKWEIEKARLVAVLRSKMVIDRSDVSRLTHLSGQHLTAHLAGLHQDRVIKLEESASATKPKQIISWLGE